MPVGAYLLGCFQQIKQANRVAGTIRECHKHYTVDHILTAIYESIRSSFLIACDSVVLRGCRIDVVTELRWRERDWC